MVWKVSVVAVRDPNECVFIFDTLAHITAPNVVLHFSFQPWPKELPSHAMETFIKPRVTPSEIVAVILAIST